MYITGRARGDSVTHPLGSAPALALPFPTPSSYSRTAYCDVTGRETRLPLKIRGEGLGPHLVFSYDSLDIQNVFLDSGHSYEVRQGTCIVRPKGGGQADGR